MKNKHSIFLINFALIAGIMTAIFSIFSIATYRQSRTILENEFMEANLYQLENTAQLLDNHIRDMQYISALLENNTTVRAYFSMSNPSLIYNDYEERIQELLLAYQESHSSIDSIYLYSACSDTVFTKDGITARDKFNDMNWLFPINNLSTDFHYFFRAKNDYFPYLLSLVKHLNLGGYYSTIVININLSMHPYLKSARTNPNQNIFIISDQAELLYRNKQQQITEPLHTIPELTCYKKTKESYTSLNTEGDSYYTYAQTPSSKYQWSYAMVTYLSEYTTRLGASKAFAILLFCTLLPCGLIIALLYSKHSVKPIYDLLYFLRNPHDMLSISRYSRSELSAIVDHFVEFIQQNATLTEELQDKLSQLHETKLVALQTQINPHFLFNTLNMIHILESEALGYQHVIPKITLDLSRLLRYSLESTVLVPMDTELYYTEIYISIAQKRYGEKLHVLLSVDDAVRPAMVPKLFLQPLIENAIFHGLAKHMKPGSTLTLSCSVTNNYCFVLVRDNGVGMNPEALNKIQKELSENITLKGSIGLKNVVSRMQLYFGSEFSIEIKSIPDKGTTLQLRFPFIQTDPD